MPPEEISPTVNAIIAVAARLEFYRNFQMRLDKWLKENPSLIAQYTAIMARIDVERVKWDVELDAIVEGVVPISPPGTDEVAGLEETVKRLSVKVATTNAVNGFMDLITEAANALQAEGDAANV